MYASCRSFQAQVRLLQLSAFISSLSAMKRPASAWCPDTSSALSDEESAFTVGSVRHSSQSGWTWSASLSSGAQSSAPSSFMESISPVLSQTPMEETDAELAGVRRRLWTKRAPPLLAIEDKRADEAIVELPALPDGFDSEPFAREDMGSEPIAREDMDSESIAREKAIVWKRFLQRYRRWVMAKCDEVNEDDEERKKTIRFQWDLKRMTLEQRQNAAKEFFSERLCDETFQRQVLDAMERQVANRSTSTKFIDVKTALLTFNGPWGVVGGVTVPEITKNPFTSNLVVEGVCEQLREHEVVLELWAEFKKTVECWKDAFFLNSVAFCMELCKCTLESEGIIRVHFHAFLRCNNSKIRIEKACQLAFKGSEPFKSDNLMGNVRSARQAGTNAGMYYLQAPKIGSIFTSGTIMPFKDYLVSGEWIMNLVQAGKLNFHTARDEIVRSAKNLPRLLASLDRWHQEMQRASLQEHMRSIQQELDAGKKPFKSIEVVNEWIRSHETNLMRYKFLVLCGGSGLGKTQFAKSLVPAERSLELNMASAPEPDLREYDPTLHDLVLFDECTPQQVLRQKKLFQCPPVEVGLAASATSCHAYKVWVHKKMFVVATNVWQYELSRLSCDDASWLVANSVLCEVLEPLWDK